MASPRSWLLLAVGADRQHGGNDGYDDEPDAHYSWDSTVPNYGKVRPGDRVVLWDKRELLGSSVVEEVESGEANKVLYRCPNCGLAGIKARRTKRPRFKCFICKSAFDKPTTRIEAVTTYRSRHDAGWVDLTGRLTGAELRGLCVSPASQHSMRELRWADFHAAVEALGASAGLGLIEDRVASRASGHRNVVTRVRIGQGRFRRDLLERYGPVCALTGPAPLAALEAGHLYSYAELGQHDDQGGLLFRRDVHRLFDSGDIAVDPTTRQIRVGPELMVFPSYCELDRTQLRVDVTAKQIHWIGQHWRQHR